MRSISIKIPLAVDIKDDHGESGAVEYGEGVADFLTRFTKGTVKSEFIGYVQGHAIIGFYTNESSPEYKKIVKKSIARVDAWCAEMDEDSRDTYCDCCDRKLRD